MGRVNYWLKFRKNMTKENCEYCQGELLRTSMTKSGELEGLSDEDALEKVVGATEQVMESA